MPKAGLMYINIRQVFSKFSEGSVHLISLEISGSAQAFQQGFEASLETSVSAELGCLMAPQERRQRRAAVKRMLNLPHTASDDGLLLNWRCNFTLVRSDAFLPLGQNGQQSTVTLPVASWVAKRGQRVAKLHKCYFLPLTTNSDRSI